MHIVYVCEEIDYRRNYYNVYQADSFTGKLVLALAEINLALDFTCYTSRLPGTPTTRCQVRKPVVIRVRLNQLKTGTTYNVIDITVDTLVTYIYVLFLLYFLLNKPSAFLVFLLSLFISFIPIASIISKHRKHVLHIVCKCN